MSDQATLSSFEDSISVMNATNTTTPPIGGTNDSKHPSYNPKDLNDLSGVLGSLNLDNNTLFTNKVPSTPPNQWGAPATAGWNFNGLIPNAHTTSDSMSSTNSHERPYVIGNGFNGTINTGQSTPFANNNMFEPFNTTPKSNNEILNRSPPNMLNDILVVPSNSFLPSTFNGLGATSAVTNANNFSLNMHPNRYMLGQQNFNVSPPAPAPAPTQQTLQQSIHQVPSQSSTQKQPQQQQQQQHQQQHQQQQQQQQQQQVMNSHHHHHNNPHHPHQSPPHNEKRNTRNSTSNVHRKHSNNNNRRGEDASKFMNANLDDFINEIYYLCKDQHGCRFLQRQLELFGEEAATTIFNEIQLNVIELMIDPFGNYLIQKLLQRVNETQRLVLVQNASPQFVRIALDPHGTRALQKLIECISTQEEYQIVIDSLKSYVVLLSRDLNGNHVIQKCLQKLPSEYCEFIFDAACLNCLKIAKHRHGCCVLQRCFDNGDVNQCERLALEVGINCTDLSTDPYGNYVVQYVLNMEELRLKNQLKDSKISRAIELILESLRNNLINLSTHKFGSNVIEKSLRIPSLSPILTNELIHTNLKLLINDAYGNYVLQTGLDVANDDTFNKLSEVLKPFLNDVRNTPHGRRIVSKLISRGGVSFEPSHSKRI